MEQQYVSDKPVKGSCLCGSIQFQYHGEALVFQYCHCSRCRKITGSAHAANIIVRPEQLEWLSGEALLHRYELPEAKDFASQCCSRCGSNLPWINQSGRAAIIPAGSLDEDPGIKPQQSIFYADHAAWYADVSDLPKHEQLPPRKNK